MLKPPHIPAWILMLWERSGGKPWEPPNPQNPHILRLIEYGFVRRADGRCGFEAFKDSFLVWTLAGQYVCTSLAASKDERAALADEARSKSLDAMPDGAGGGS